MFNDATSTAGMAATAGTDPKLYAAMTALSALSQLASGAASFGAGRSEAEALEAQGAIAREDARIAAIQKARDVTQFQAAQGQAYLASGVTLEGTPVIVMEETRRQGQQEVDALIKRGAAMQALYRSASRQTNKSGRGAFLEGILGAGATGLKGYVEGQNVGLWGQGSKPQKIPGTNKYQMPGGWN